jgi:hypothetical protein
MTDPRNPAQNQPPREQYEALRAVDLSTGRHVEAGDQFDATREELGTLIEGTDYKRVQKP